VLAALLVITIGGSRADAWGCDGHRTVVVLAERLLGPATLTAMREVLSASPVDPQLKRGCQPVAGDRLVDEATWADDERAVDPETASWHFVNYPRSIGAHTENAAPYCRSCAITAIAAEFQTLTTTGDRARKANALRYLLHLIGDIHQPMHAITNGDRGGNCVPVTFLGQPPVEDDRGNFAPNLHAVWDAALVGRLMSERRLHDVNALADYVAKEKRLPDNVTAQPATAALVASWARGTNGLARSVAYGRLPVPLPLEPATALTLSSCEDNRDVAGRSLSLHERLAEPYVKAATPVIVGQLRLAAVRLASAMKFAFPS
jgi:hypothetical protein